MTTGEGRLVKQMRKTGGTKTDERNTGRDGDVHDVHHRPPARKTVTVHRSKECLGKRLKKIIRLLCWGGGEGYARGRMQIDGGKRRLGQ